MSDEILNDEQLDAVAGGVDTVVIVAKTSTTAYATTVRSDKIAPTTTPTYTIDRTAVTNRLASM